jgi:hypothetical protein
MVSQIKVNEIIKQSGSSITIGESGDTVSVPSGATLNVAGSTSGLPDNTPVFAAYLSDNADQSVTDSTLTKIQFDAERIDTAGAFDTSNYRFTVPSGQAGKYLIVLQAKFSSTSQNTVVGSFVYIYKNGSSYHSTGYTGAGYISGSQYNILGNQLNLSTVIDLAVSDYIEGYGFVKVSSGTPKIQEGDDQATWIEGFKLV